jgi:YhcN/YlaJ family sporulation lipoprotein
MARKHQRLPAVLALLAACALAAAGCTARQEPAPSPQAQELPAAPDAELRETDIRDTAARLEALAESVAGVRDANCVIFGNYAIVGVDVEENLDRSRVGTIKYSVAEALRKDPDGARAVVTADIDLAQRIREIRDDIRQGRPIAGFAEELADIVGRLIPQFPGGAAPRKDPEQAQQENDGASAASRSGHRG